MKNLLTVREYGLISKDDCPNFDELIKFTEASEFLSLGWRRNGGVFVQAKNYIGVIRLPSGFQIEILPKLDAPNEKLRGLVVKMLSTLKNFASKKFLNAELLTEQIPLYEIFIRAYLEMIAELVKRGLKSSYTVREENLNIFKGKLLVAENLRRNFAHSEKFFVAYDEYSLDRAEHRLIKATLFKLLHSTRDNKNFRLASRLLGDFEKFHDGGGQGGGFGVALRHEQTFRGLRCRTYKKIFLRPLYSQDSSAGKIFVRRAAHFQT